MVLPYGPAPTRFAWLIKMAQPTAAYSPVLLTVMADPEMAALVAANVRPNRIVRSLFRMLAVKPLPGVLPPLPRRNPRPAAIREGRGPEKVGPTRLASTGPTTSARARWTIFKSLSAKSRSLASPEERAREWGVALLCVPSEIV